MDDTIRSVLVLAYGYLLGSVPAAYIAAKAVKGIDLRKVGTGTVGTSNVWYHVGKAWIFPIGIFDAFVKGMTPAFVARGLGLGIEVQAAAAMLAVVGHNWPIFLRFQGGRGVAPTVGALVAMGRLELGVFIVLATAGWQLTRNAAVWVLIGFASLPLTALYWERPGAIVALMAGLLLVTVAKRLASNTRGTPGVSKPRLLLNRLLYDRDIADHDAWVRRQAEAAD